MTYIIKKINLWLPYIILALIAAGFIWPIMWIIFASFDTNAEMGIHLPDHWTLDNYIKVLSNPMNSRSFYNGLVISLSQAFGTLFFSVLAAYPLSKFKLKGKAKILYTMLFLTGLPITAIMVPIYMVFFQLEMIDSTVATIFFLIASALPYSIWMIKNFLDHVPKEIEEAALIDGAGSLKTLWHVILPVIMPGIVVVFIFNFSGSWGNFFVPYILLNSPEKLPASVAIFQFFGTYGQVQYGELAAYALLYTIPIIILYILAQRFMSEGFSLNGSVK